MNPSVPVVDATGRATPAFRAALAARVSVPPGDVPLTDKEGRALPVFQRLLGQLTRAAPNSSVQLVDKDGLPTRALHAVLR